MQFFEQAETRLLLVYLDGKDLSVVRTSINMRIQVLPALRPALTQPAPAFHDVDHQAPPQVQEEDVLLREDAARQDRQ